jgi:hypothetical protein
MKEGRLLSLAMGLAVVSVAAGVFYIASQAWAWLAVALASTGSNYGIVYLLFRAARKDLKEAAHS